MTKSYFHIPLSKRAQRYAEFVTPFGAYIPKVMMFGLRNAPYYFCKLMAEVLGDIPFAVPYIDEIAVFSSDWKQYLKDLDVVFEKLGEDKLRVRPVKCRFAQNHVKFLGDEIGSGKRKPNEVKIKAIMEFPMPITKT